jgi:hypothetical protein
MRRARHAFAWPAMVAALTCAAQPDGSTLPLLLKVPPEVSRHVAARAKGDASSPPPILMLEQVEVGAGEGLNIHVLGPADQPDPKTGEPMILAVAGTVGSPQKAPEAPVQVMDLVIPLDDKALALLAGKEEIRLTLRVVNSPGRPPLKLKRAYFHTGESRK